jgi:hypothetical protein
MFPSRLAAGRDFATDVLKDPWDFSNVEDLAPERLGDGGLDGQCQCDRPNREERSMVVVLKPEIVEPQRAGLHPCRISAPAPTGPRRERPGLSVEVNQKR